MITEHKYERNSDDTISIDAMLGTISIDAMLGIENT